MNRLCIRGQRWRTVGKLVGIGLLACCATRSVEASPSRHRAWRPVPKIVPYSQQFYRVALQRHQSVAVPYRLRTLQAHDGLLPETPFIEYLRWRRSLNPSRFDVWHPHMGRLLETDRIIRSQVFTPPITSNPPAVDAQPPIHVPRPDEPQILPPGTSVPEPSTALMGLTMIGALAAWQRARRLREQASDNPRPINSLVD
jgi:hypothetical protein